MIDVNSNGKIIDWKDKKLRTLDLSESYGRLGESFYKKAIRVQECGTYLEYRRFHDQSMKLNQANFCKVRLCPMCSWRRSLKIYGQVSKIMDHVTLDKDMEFLFLTLSTRNVDGSDLNSSINQLFKGFKKMTKRLIFKKSILGHFRALEVTHNLNKYSDWYDTYHPHIHAILVVNKNYFKKSDLYINQNEWVELWQDVLGINYRPIVHIKKSKDIKGQGMQKTIAEVAKYTTKSDDYIVHDPQTNEILEEMTDQAVFILDKALARRRLTAFGGILKEIHQQLNLDHQEDGDLINTDNEDLRDDLDYIIEKYSWNIGYKQYIKVI